MGRATGFTEAEVGAQTLGPALARLARACLAEVQPRVVDGHPAHPATPAAIRSPRPPSTRFRWRVFSGSRCG
jgi:hypothetical protein